MPQFTKKPVTIEALRLGVATEAELKVFCPQLQVHCADSGAFVIIETLEGQMRGNIGDWIIRGVSGEFYPCKNEIFEKTYRAGGPEPVAYDSKADTLEHIRTLTFMLNNVVREFLHRIEIHDVGKLGVNEKPIFDEMTPKLKASTYMSDEYKGFLKHMDTALQHHYATNRHHPEFFDHGIQGMNLIDLLEMLCDWFAATKRHANGDLMKSIDLNATRFGYGAELIAIFKNTARWLQGEKLDYVRPVKKA